MPSQDSTAASKLLLVANTGWYLYNFRLSLAADLAREGYEVVLVCPQDEYSKDLIEAGYRLILWELDRQIAPLWLELRSVFQLQRIYRRENPALVNHFTLKTVIYGSLAARMAGVPRVVNSITGRGYVFQAREFKAVLLRLVIDPIFRLIYHKLNAATTFENESDLEYFIEGGLIPNQNIHLVKGVGVDVNWFNYSPEEPTEQPIIVFPGRFLWAKGVGTLIDAARILKKRLSVRIVLVGRPDPGNPETIPEELIHSWVGEGLVEWWGWQADMRAVFHKSHIVVLPSMGEGLSKALLEALSCGRPIVATDVPGCRELVIPGVTGYLLPINDPQAIADELERLCRNPELRTQMGLAGRRLAEEEFVDSKINQHILDIYHSLLHP